MPKWWIRLSTKNCCYYTDSVGNNRVSSRLKIDIMARFYFFWLNFYRYHNSPIYILPVIIVKFNLSYPVLNQQRFFVLNIFHPSDFSASYLLLYIPWYTKGWWYEFNQERKWLPGMNEKITCKIICSSNTQADEYYFTPKNTVSN